LSYLFESEVPAAVSQDVSEDDSDDVYCQSMRRHDIRKVGCFEHLGDPEKRDSAFVNLATLLLFYAVSHCAAFAVTFAFMDKLFIV